MSDPTNTSSTQEQFRRSVSRREAMNAFKNLAPVRAGENYLLRYSFMARVEHFALLVSVTMLGLTGLAQTFETNSVARFILSVLGGIDKAQKVHHIFAALLGILAVFHLFDLLDRHFVRKEASELLPSVSDVTHFSQMLGLFFGLNKELPLFGRYKPDQKFLYWVVALTVVISGVTGLVMLFPVQAAAIVTGAFYPFAVLIHRWQAILLVSIVLILHTYQFLLPRGNKSIFNGRMSVENMEWEHPVELAFMQKAAGLADAKTWPQVINFTAALPLNVTIVTTAVETKEIESVQLSEARFPVEETTPAVVVPAASEAPVVTEAPALAEAPVALVASAALAAPEPLVAPEMPLVEETTALQAPEPVSKEDEASTAGAEVVTAVSEEDTARADVPAQLQPTEEIKPVDNPKSGDTAQ